MLRLEKKSQQQLLIQDLHSLGIRICFSFLDSMYRQCFKSHFTKSNATTRQSQTPHSLSSSSRPQTCTTEAFAPTKQHRAGESARNCLGTRKYSAKWDSECRPAPAHGPALPRAAVKSIDPVQDLHFLAIPPHRAAGGRARQSTG